MAVEEFNLATSAKQDQILSNFPIKRDPVHESVTGLVAGYANTDYRKKTILDIRGKGVLLGVSGSSQYSIFEIFVDGETLASALKIGKGHSPISIEFKTRLVVSIWNGLDLNTTIVEGSATALLK